MDKPLAFVLLLLLASPVAPSLKMESSVIKQLFGGLFHGSDDNTVEPSTTGIHTTTEPTTTTTPTPTTTNIATTTTTSFEPSTTTPLQGKTTSSDSNNDSDNTEMILTIVAFHVICLTVMATIWLCFVIHKYVKETFADRQKVGENGVDPDGYETFVGGGPHLNRSF